MNSKWATLGVALLVFGLSGCATMSGDECATSDWSAVGSNPSFSGSNEQDNKDKSCAEVDRLRAGKSFEFITETLRRFTHDAV